MKPHIDTDDIPKQPSLVKAVDRWSICMQSIAVLNLISTAVHIQRTNVNRSSNLCCPCLLNGQHLYWTHNVHTRSVSAATELFDRWFVKSLASGLVQQSGTAGTCNRNKVQGCYRATLVVINKRSYTHKSIASCEAQLARMKVGVDIRGKLSSGDLFVRFPGGKCPGSITGSHARLCL